MADASHPNPSDALHYSEEHTKHRSGSVGYAIIGIILVAAIIVLGFKLKQQDAALATARNQLEQSNTDLTAAKANVTTAEGKATALQAQLDQSRRESTDLQGRVKNAEDASSTLQTQLTQAKSDAQSQQQKLQSEADQMQAQVNQANEATARLKQDLTGAQRQIEDLKGQLAKAQETASATAAPMKVAAAARTLPLAGEFKKSFFGGTFSLQLKNQGTEPLKVNLEITGSDKTPSRDATIEGNGTFKLSGLAPGAKIVVNSEGFQPLTLTAQ